VKINKERCSVCGIELTHKDIRVYLSRYILCKECLRMGLNYLAGVKRLEARRERRRQKDAERRNNPQRKIPRISGNI
jgi:hypothetical protein